MRTLFRAWSIWLISVIIKECQSFKCLGPIWNNCTCTDFRDIELLCPFLENHEIELKITKKKSIDLQCVTESANYADLVPKINISGYQSLSIKCCDTYQKFGDVLKKLHLKNLKRLYFENMPYIDKNMYVTNITEELFSSLETLEKLSFSYSNVQFSKDFLSNTPELLYLILTHVYLREININLDYVPRLRRLHLSMNQISSIENGTFKNLANLTNLHLDNNNLKYLNRRVFSGLKNLKLLDLSRNSIQQLTEDCFAELNGLAYLSIDGNEIKEIHSRMFENNNLLRVIVLQSNKLTDVPGDIFRNCDKLEEIYLGDNKLTALSENIFNNLKKLKILDLSANRFSILPENILFPLVSLKSLDVSFNKLSSFDLNAVYNFHDFILLLSHNQIRRYPKATGIRMNKLDLSFNEIEHIEIQEIIASSAFNVDLRNNKIQLVDLSLPRNLLKQSSGSDTRFSVQLEDNPIACNCSNYDLIRYNNGNLRDVNAIMDISQEKLKCLESLDLVTTINPDAILCPVVYGCPRPCQCFYKPQSGDVIVNCASTNSTIAPFIPEAINLTGSDAHGKSIEGRFFANVTHLDLSGNHISDIQWMPRYLKVLNLSDNKLNNLDENFVSTLRKSPNLNQLYLGNNPWKCDCESFELQRYIMEYYRKVNSSDVYCQNIDEKLVNIKHLCLSSIDISILLSLLFGVFLFISAAVAIFYRYERNIRIYLKTKDICMWIFSKDHFEKDKEYDVFLSYSHQDEQFVMESLLSELESEQKPFKICIHNRDWVPGKLITDQIVSSVENSRKTLIVLSNNFLESVWGKTEFRFAHSKAMSEDRRILIVVIYGDINEEKLDEELKIYIRSNTYIKWGEPFFWTKLRGAIGHSRN